MGEKINLGNKQGTWTLFKGSHERIQIFVHTRIHISYGTHLNRKKAKVKFKQ